MFNGSMKQRAGKWLVIATLLSAGLAMAQAEPTLKQVYEEAQAGRLDQAQVMMQQVLVAHPGSAKAHFVQAELAARQGKAAMARESLAQAEKLAPGLPFAKPEAVQALRTQLTAKTGASTGSANNSGNNGSSSRAVAAAPSYSSPAAPASSFPWGLALALGGGAIGLGIYLTRKKAAPAMAPQAAYANVSPMQGGLNGPQGFGMGNNPMATNMPGGMNNMNNMGGGMAPGYGQQPAGMGLGGKVMGGLATGLAVGAGVMAAQAIGKSLMGNESHPAAQPDHLANNNSNGYEPIAANNDMGGQNFGLADTGSWDDGDALASSGDMGGDWDS